MTIFLLINLHINQKIFHSDVGPLKIGSFKSITLSDMLAVKLCYVLLSQPSFSFSGVYL